MKIECLNCHSLVAVYSTETNHKQGFVKGCRNCGKPQLETIVTTTNS